MSLTLRRTVLTFRLPHPSALQQQGRMNNVSSLTPSTVGMWILPVLLDAYIFLSGSSLLFAFTLLLLICLLFLMLVGGTSSCGTSYVHPRRGLVHEYYFFVTAVPGTLFYYLFRGKSNEKLRKVTFWREFLVYCSNLSSRSWYIVILSSIPFLVWFCLVPYRYTGQHISIAYVWPDDDGYVSIIIIR